MGKRKIPYLWVGGTALVFIMLMAVPLLYQWFEELSASPTERAIRAKLLKEGVSFGNLKYDLVDPEESPTALHEAVMLGYRLMIDTPKYAPAYAGDHLSCTNCHFSGGNMIGGRNGSIPLSGIAAAYPDYNERAKTVVTLPERINGCFRRSMNGKPLPLNSREMDAFVAYFHWISKSFPIYTPVPWRGLEPIKSERRPDPENGKRIFAEKCALCHGTEGEGAVRIPPLWGPHSYNDGAGMHRIETFAAFVHANMPYEDPSLTEEEALDVAAFVHRQPRPKYEP